MITAYVLVNRETHEKYQEIYVDCSLTKQKNIDIH